MKREIERLSEGVYDLCVIGGGIYGACVVWEAILRGLSVALIDKGDFGHATSSNSLRIIHGGFRYLQNGDIIRMRESIRERMVWMRIAPHLVHPLPFLIPTYRYAMKGKTLLAMAASAYDLIAIDRNRLSDPQKYIPRGRVITRQECLRLMPELDTRNLTGAAIFYDGQMHNSERLLLAFLKSAAKRGAVLANYVELVDFLRTGNRVVGVKAKDVFTGDPLDIRARVVVNTTGPWVNDILSRLHGTHVRRSFSLSKAINLGVTQLFPKYAVALHARDSRLFFITPWHHRSLIGTAHLPCDGGPARLQLHEEDIHDFITDIRTACPSIPLREEDVLFCHSGLIPAQSVQPGRQRVQLVRRGQILDHRKDSGVEGLLSVVGVKFTEARSMAVKVVDRVFAQLGYKPPPSESSEVPIYGGAIDRFNEFLAATVARSPYRLQERTLRRLVLNYGAAYGEVLKYAEQDPDSLGGCTADGEILNAEVLYGIKEEMAQTLADVVFRRTELGTLGHPGKACLTACATIVARELGWDQARIADEITEVESALSFGAAYG